MTSSFHRLSSYIRGMVGREPRLTSRSRRIVAFRFALIDPHNCFTLIDCAGPTCPVVTGTDCSGYTPRGDEMSYQYAAVVNMYPFSRQ